MTWIGAGAQELGWLSSDPSSTPTTCVTLGMLLNLSKAQFSLTEKITNVRCKNYGENSDLLCILFM